MKVGDIVECVKDWDGLLTVGKRYEVVDLDRDGDPKVICDDGLTCFFRKEHGHFKVVSATVPVTVNLPAIEGYEYTGEYRFPEAGEYYMDRSTVVTCTYNYNAEYPILRKLPTQRPVTKDDVGKTVQSAKRIDSMEYTLVHVDGDSAWIRCQFNNAQYITELNTLTITD